MRYKRIKKGVGCNNYSDNGINMNNAFLLDVVKFFSFVIQKEYCNHVRLLFKQMGYFGNLKMNERVRFVSVKLRYLIFLNLGSVLRRILYLKMPLVYLCKNVW